MPLEEMMNRLKRVQGTNLLVAENFVATNDRPVFLADASMCGWAFHIFCFLHMLPSVSLAA